MDSARFARVSADCILPSLTARCFSRVASLIGGRGCSRKCSFAILLNNAQCSAEYFRPRWASASFALCSGDFGTPTFAALIFALCSGEKSLLASAWLRLARDCGDGRYPSIPSPPAVWFARCHPLALPYATHHRSAALRSSADMRLSRTTISKLRPRALSPRIQRAQCVFFARLRGLPCVCGRFRPLEERPIYLTSRVSGSINPYTRN